jgi:hypothetical protein
MVTTRSDPYYITEADRMELEYERRKPLAWANASESLAAHDAQQQEPVAWRVRHYDSQQWMFTENAQGDWKTEEPLYTHPSQDARDAARYRWLRDVATEGDWNWLRDVIAEKLDTAIDETIAAMEAKK